MNKLTFEGKEYPLDEWLTLPAYAKKYNLPVPSLYSRIQREQIPATALLEVPQWGLKLIRDEVYPVDRPGPKPRKKGA